MKAKATDNVTKKQKKSFLKKILGKFLVGRKVRYVRGEGTSKPKSDITKKDVFLSKMIPGYKKYVNSIRKSERDSDVARRAYKAVLRNRMIRNKYYKGKIKKGMTPDQYNEIHSLVNYRLTKNPEYMRNDSLINGFKHDRDRMAAERNYLLRKKAGSKK